MEETGETWKCKRAASRKRDRLYREGTIALTNSSIKQTLRREGTEQRNS